MFDKLSTLESQYEELAARLGTAEVQSDASEYRKAAKRLSDLEPLVQKYREYKVVQKDIEGAEELVEAIEQEGVSSWKLETALPDLEQSLPHVPDEAQRSQLRALLLRLRALLKHSNDPPKDP